MGILNKQIETKIYDIRETKVMIDSDIARLYQVETRRIMEQVKRNKDRFPADFMFQLTKDEFENLKSQNATSSWGGKRKLPYAFTEQGVYMLSTVLKSKIATKVTVNIMRTFTKLREFAINYKDIVIELQNMKEEIASTRETGKQNSQHIKRAFELLSQILDDTAKTEKNLIGFRPNQKQ